VSGWLEAPAPAKLNLALLVGPLRPDGKHEVMTILERLSLADTVRLRRAETTTVHGYPDDTLVAAALEAIGAAAGTSVRFEARIEKRIPVAAGLGGGSSDAATALRLANQLLEEPLSPDELHTCAAALGSDVSFFLCEGLQLATGDGTTLTPVTLPRDYAVLLALREGDAKDSTRAVYEAFDARGGADGFSDRRRALEVALAQVEEAADLAALPRNDLASSPLAALLEERGAIRADVTGAGPIVYGLFTDHAAAQRAATGLRGVSSTWIATPDEA